MIVAVRPRPVGDRREGLLVKLCGGEETALVDTRTGSVTVTDMGTDGRSRGGVEGSQDRGDTR